MPPTTTELLQLRSWALETHRNWKSRSRRADDIANGKWNVVWPDLTTEENDPTVENVYLEALEDKAAAAAGIFPYIDVTPTRGTRHDRAEEEAQKRRRAFISLMQQSDFDNLQIRWAMDWLQHGVMVSMPWSNPKDGWYPYSVRIDPRFFYPISHNSAGELTSCLYVRNRRVVDLRNEYENADAILGSWPDWKREQSEMPRPVEEIWYVDQTTWGVALVNSQRNQIGDYRYTPPEQSTVHTPQAEWVVPPEPHKLKANPVVEQKRETPDGEYRGVLDSMLPNLRVAHNIMSRILGDLDRAMYVPPVQVNIENPEDFGPDAQYLLGEDRDADIKFPRPPVNFEAMQHAATQVEAARNVGNFPQQRSGEFGASIASQKGVVAVQGGYNTQLGWVQTDLARFYRETLGRLANYDEAWCGGYRKEITGYDEGELFSDKYDAATFWKGDYRVFVGFHSHGMEEHALLTRLALAKNMGGMARRTFMRQSGLVDNPLAEERDIALEAVTDAFTAFMMEQAASGNPKPLQDYVAKIDDDDETVRSAAFNVIKEMFTVPSDSGGGAPGGGGPDALLQAASLDAGGIPGQARGLPPAVGSDLRSLLPAGLGRALGEGAPGA